MTTVLLAGAFGQHNPGDEALLRAFRLALADYRIIATSAEPEATAAQHDCEAVPSGDVRAIASLVRKSDAVVIGGGTVFKTLHPSTRRPAHELLRNTSLLTLGARVSATPVLIVGVSAVPLPDRRARRLARRVVRRADLLILRDEPSARHLADAGSPTPFRIGADPTWTLLGDATPVADVESTVVVMLSHLAASRDLASRIAPGLRALRDDGLRVCLQPWQVSGSAAHNGADDLVFMHEIGQRIGGPVELLDAPADLDDAVRRAGTSRLVVGMRFHSLVAAAAAGTPFLAIDHESKLGALARQFSQQSVAGDAKPAQLTTAMFSALSGVKPSASAAQHERARAAEGFRLLRLLLEGGQTPELEELTGLPLEPASWGHAG